MKTISDITNDEVRERYELAMERIAQMQQERTVAEKYRPYFDSAVSLILLVNSIVEMKQDGRLRKLTLDEHKALNRALYEDISGDNYNTSWTNPNYACKAFGTRMGKFLSFLMTELRSIIVSAYEGRLYELTIYLELFIQIYNYFENEDENTYNVVKKAVYDFLSDNCEYIFAARIQKLLDTDASFDKDIIMNEDLSDLRYLYLLGEHITDNELKTARFLNSLPEQKLIDMANTFTEGFRLGFIAKRLDITKKKIVDIRYQVGFERMIYYAVKNFRKMGLEPVISRSPANVFNRRSSYSTSPNRQYNYDHRFDIGLFFDKALTVRMHEAMRKALETFKDEGAVYAGPAVVEVFGEELFSPGDKKEAIKLNKRQQNLMVNYRNAVSLMQNDYLRMDEVSFTIISYPIPEIGKDYERIFEDTIKVNTLDNEQYRKIQQTIIDTLDQGEYVKIVGRGSNHTDMTVSLHPLEDPASQTKFENCVADVNIPVGEVFTSPVLKGTKGVLHVPRIYLNGLEYRELELTFEDGKIADYNCRNFEQEAKNKSYIKENLMFNHDYLPLGEFSIGTNTTAYMMGRKYDIAPKLPILIAEKTGPHFAIGDTCYYMSEDNKVYNPDGKEIIARDNEISILRKSEPGKAYFNCHTDITLPYDEIGEISVYTKDGKAIPIIKNSRFVLPGTEVLNEAFDTMA